MNRQFLFLAVFVALVAFASRAQASPYSDAVLADNPFVYYRFEENAGPTAMNMGNLGAAANGTYVGPVTLGGTEIGAPVGLGNSVQLTAAGNYVDVPNVGANFTQLSVEMWVNADGLAGGCCTSLFSTDSFNTDGNGSSLHFNVKSGRDVEHAMHNGSPQNINTPGGLIQNDTWYHIVGTYNDVTGETAMYVDGVQQALANRPAAGPIDLSDTGQIGAWNNGRVLPGHIDEFAFYDTVLTPAQVQTHFDAAFLTAPSPQIPEPASIAIWTLIGVVLAGFGYVRFRRRK